MAIKILTKNSIDNTNIDGARQNHFSAGMRSGIVKGAFNEGKFFASASNIIALDTCELRVSGHQVIIDSIEAITLSDRPSTPTTYSMIAEIQVSDMSVPSFRLFIQPASVGLRQENLFKTNNGSGTYQLRIGNFTLGTAGLITDVIRTADIITGGGEGGIADIKFNATATQLSSSSQPTANIDYNEETKEYDAHFGIPAGSGTDVTIGGITQNEWSADFAESERQKSKNLLPLKESFTQGNVTVDINKDTGLITLSGTVSGSSYVISESEIYLKAGKKYTLSIQNYRGSGKNLLTLRAKKVSDGTVVNDYLYTYQYNASITPTEDMIIYRASFYFSTSSNVNFSCYVQLEEGEETEYVKYQGGRILHEEDIADVEHYKVIYDKTSSDTNLNWGYTSGIQSSVVISRTFPGKKTYRVYFCFGGSNYGCVLVRGFGDTENNFSGGCTIRSLTSGNKCEFACVMMGNLFKPVFYLAGEERINSDTYVYRIEEITL